jgi:predicted nucleic acid-binding protein
MTEPPAVVLDTNVFVAAGFRPDGDAARVLAAVGRGALRLVWDDATRRETEFIVRKIPPLSWAAFVSLFRDEGRFAGPTDLHAFVFIPDPDDLKFAALAAASGATLLTLDRHLLAGRPHPDVTVLTPGEFLRQSRAGGPR